MAVKIYPHPYAGNIRCPQDLRPLPDTINTTGMDPTMFMFAVAMFSVRCTTIWFALSHAEIIPTEEKPESITRQLGRINKKIEKQ
jgi:hypothetical protein